MGRGFLTGQIKSPDDLAPSDWRRSGPRFQGQSLQNNLELVQRIEELAKKKNAKPAQIALAWVLAQGQDIIPIPGTKRIKYLEENLAALSVELSRQELDELSATFAPGAVAGARYPESGMKSVNR